jgi:hypothetical protein
MAAPSGLSRHNHLSEFNSPLFTNEGVKSPSERKALALANLGMSMADSSVRILRDVPAPATATDTATLTAAQLVNGVIEGTPTAAANYTLPTAASVLALLPSDFAVGDAFEFVIVNLAATATFDITLVTGTGWGTLPPSIVVGAGASAAGTGAEYTVGRFRARQAVAGELVLSRVG